MARRKPDAAFLTTLIELRFHIGIIQSVMEQDDALTALARTGFAQGALDATRRDFAQPFLVSLRKFLGRAYARSLNQFEHGEHVVTFSALSQLIEHALKHLADESEPSNCRRYATNFNLTRAKDLVGTAILSEIGVRFEEQTLEAEREAERAALAAERAEHRAVKK
jgi:hypothetical protein